MDVSVSGFTPFPSWSAPSPIDGVPETDCLPQVHRQEGGLPGCHASTG